MMGFSRIPVYWLRNPFVVIGGIGLIGLLISLIVFNVLVWPRLGNASNSHSSAASTRTLQAAPGNSPISPFIFGSNLTQLDNHNQVLLSVPTRALVQQLHVRMIRIPMAPVASPDAIVKAAKIVRDTGATPLVVLYGPTDPHALNDDTQIIKIMSTIFGQDTVYYEYDDEADLAGVTANSYTISWNSVIPVLKQLAPQAKFIGPVNYQYNQQYLSAFLQHAQPLPGGVSWHEYTCNAAWSRTLCLANISQWTTHISNARSTIATLIGRELPVLITEWNYAANPAPDDGKSNDSTFMTDWTTRAIQTLIENHVFAALQYSCTNSAAPLIGSNNQLTAQGKVFRQQYENFIASKVVQSAPTPTPSPAPTSTPTQIPTPTPTQIPTPTPMPTPSPTPIIQQICAGTLSSGWTSSNNGPAECNYQAWNAVTPTSAYADYSIGTITAPKTYALIVYVTPSASAYMNYDPHVGDSVKEACPFNSRVSPGWHYVCSFSVSASDVGQTLSIHEWSGQVHSGLVLVHSAIELEVVNV